jgi:hypothetical protein
MGVFPTNEASPLIRYGLSLRGLKLLGLPPLQIERGPYASPPRARASLRAWGRVSPPRYWFRLISRVSPGARATRRTLIPNFNSQ